MLKNNYHPSCISSIVAVSFDFKINNYIDRNYIIDLK